MSIMIPAGPLAAKMLPEEDGVSTTEELLAGAGDCVLLNALAVGPSCFTLAWESFLRRRVSVVSWCTCCNPMERW